MRSEGYGLIAVTTTQFEPGLCGHLLHASARLLEGVDLGRAHRHVTGEPEGGMSVGQLPLPLDEDVFLTPTSRRGQEAAAPS